MSSQKRLSTQLAVGFGAAFALVVTLGAVAWTSTTALRHRLEDLAANHVGAANELGVLAEAHTAVMRRLNGTALGRDFTPEQRANSAAKAKEAMDRYDAAYARFLKLDLEPTVAAAAKVLAEKDAPFRRTTEQAFALARERDGKVAAGARPEEIAGYDARVRALWEQASREVKPTDDALVALEKAQAEDTGREVALGQQAAARFNLLVSVVVLASAGALLGLWWLLARSTGRSVRMLVTEAEELKAAVAAGRLSQRADPARVGPEFRPVVAGMNHVMDAYAAPLAVATDHLVRISRGDIPPPITDAAQGDFALIRDALNRCSASLDGLLRAMDDASRRQLEGDHDAAVDEQRFEGAYRRVAAGVNAGVKHHVDALLHVLEVLQAYVAGDFSRQVRRFPGKQRVAHEAMDQVRDNLRAVAAEVTELARHARAGDLSARADASRFRGEWAAMVHGIDAALQAVVEPLRATAATVERISRGDLPAPSTAPSVGELEVLRNSLNGCITAVAALVTDVDGLSRAAVEGRLAERADASRHQGDFRRIVSGVNATLDATVAPVEEATRVLEQLADRDLRVRMEGEYRGDHARLEAALNQTAHRLHEALQQVASAVEQVSGAASQIASSSQAVASGASEQASALTETSGSVESVSAQARHAAAAAQEATRIAGDARGAAAAGVSAVQQMQGAMAQIRASAEGTSQIIKDVSDIAFQTNLLALNAAVEAARAGEAGRGFAVVAEEVRSLALRAKEAAQKTEALIRESVRHAGDGEGAARHVAGRLDEIAGGVEKVTAMVSEIATSASAQTQGVDQVNRAITEMDKVTQQNAASAEESSSAASELSSQAEELAAMIATFKLAQAAPVAAARPLPAARPAPARLPPPRAAAAAPRSGKAAAFPMDDEDADLRNF